MCNDRKTLLIGGAGYVGTAVAGHLLKSGRDVNCIDNFIYEHRDCISELDKNEKFNLVDGDFLSDAALNRALRDVSDVVILAGLVGDPITKKYPDESDKVNADGIEKLFLRLDRRQLNRVIFISTCSNYGLHHDDKLADEQSELNPLSKYAHAKVEAEKTILNLRGKVDYKPTILRFATAFGLSERMRFDLTVNEFTRDMFLGKLLKVYDPDTWRPYCHVNDFARLIERVISLNSDKAAFEVFNAGGNSNNATKRSLVELILKLIPNSPIEYVEHGIDRRNYRVNFAKVRKELSFEPHYSIEDGVRELIEAMKDGRFLNVEENRDFHGNYNIYKK